MEDDGDDKDDSKRRTRNLSEKKRRDQFNMLVTELGTLITTNNRKMDKSTVLKSTVSFLKNHNEVTVRSRAHDVQEDWKPAFLSNEEFTYLVLEALEGFVMVFSASGRIYYVSESITSLLGHNPVDVVNKTIFDLAFEEDRPNLYNLLQRSAMATEQMSNSLKENEMIRFQIHLQRGTLDFREDVSYDLVEFFGHFQINQDQIDEERMGYQPDHDSRMLFICICRLYTPQLIRDVSLVDSNRNEFTSRHSLEWKFLFLDHRAPPIIGYLPFEVLGTSGYDYYHFDDLEKVVTCHEALMQKGELTSCYYRFLTKGQQWIWLQTRFYITYHQWNAKPEFVVCTHRVVSYADVSKTTKEEVVDADVTEEANQNSMKDTLAEEPIPSMSPSYTPEDVSDAYGNTDRPVSQSTLMVPPRSDFLQPVTQPNFTSHTAAHADVAQVQLPMTSHVSLTNIAVTLKSPSYNEQSTFLQSRYMPHLSSEPVPSFCSDSASAQPDKYTLSKSHSDTANQAVPQSDIAIQATSQPDSLLEVIAKSNAVTRTISHSNLAICSLAQSNAAVQAITLSKAALQVISQSNEAIQIISQLKEAIIAKSQSDPEVHAITQSNIATQTVSVSNADIQSHSNVEKQNMWLSNTKKSFERSDAEPQLNTEVQVIWQSNAGTHGFPIIPMVARNKPPMTPILKSLLPEISPSYTAETATDDFGNSFQLVSQNNMLTMSSPDPHRMSPWYKPHRSDSYNNSFQSERALRTPAFEGRLAVSPYDLSERSDSLNSAYPPYCRAASVKSASAGSTTGTINTAATTGASWSRTQTHYAAGSETGSLSEDSRSSQRNSERESHKPLETIVAPQHGIGAQYLESTTYSDSDGGGGGSGGGGSVGK